MKSFTLHISPIRGLIAAAVTAFSSTALSQDALEDVLNYVEYSPTFASAGQPDAEQFRAIRDAGFERIVYIAFTTNDNALPDADRIVEDLGMDYLHIPVEWTDPQPRDFYIFADTMQRNPDMKTLLHCQVNARATAFSFLYRVIHDDIDIATAKADMNTVWQPNETWRDFIFTVLEQEGIDPRCEDCDWAPSDTGN